MIKIKPNAIDEQPKNEVNYKKLKELFPHVIELQKQILNIANKDINSYVLAENSWTKLTPYIWEKSIKKFGAK